MRGLRSVATAALIGTAVLLAAPATGQAAEVSFVIGSSGLFNASDPGTVIGTRTLDNLNGLRFAARDVPYFGGTTVNGALPFQLGTFSLDDRTAGYAGASFTLGLLFYTPLGIVGASAVDNSATATATVAGSITGAPAGVHIDFDNAPMTFGFLFRQGSEPFAASGTFALVLDDLFVPLGGSVPITGEIVDASQQLVAAIPEPAPAVLVGAGLAALAARLRSRAFGFAEGPPAVGGSD